MVTVTGSATVPPPAAIRITACSVLRCGATSVLTAETSKFGHKYVVSEPARATPSESAVTSDEPVTTALNGTPPTGALSQNTHTLAVSWTKEWGPGGSTAGKYR